MNKKLLERRAYVSPMCTIIGMQQEQFFCTSVRPNAGGSEEKDYDPDEDIDGGEHEFE